MGKQHATPMADAAANVEDVLEGAEVPLLEDEGDEGGVPPVVAVFAEVFC